MDIQRIKFVIRMVEFETTDTDTHMDIFGYLEDYVRDSKGRVPRQQTQTHIWICMDI